LVVLENKMNTPRRKIHSLPDWKATLLLCLICAAITAIGWGGVAYGSDESKRKILAVLEEFPVPKEDWGESPDLRKYRLDEVAGAVSAIGDPGTRAMVVAIGYHESKWSSDICDGRKLGDRGKAYGCFQAHDPDRSGGISGQVERAARDARRARNYCRSKGYHPVKGGFSLYGTGKVCTHPFPARWATYQRIVGRL
jgi:hypothetical protein